MYRSALSVFILSSFIVFVLIQFVSSWFILQRIIVGLLAVILTILAGFVFPPVKRLIIRKGKWILVFFAILLVQLILLTTGGFLSPYLILIHLFFFGLSFLFSVGVALLFLGFSLSLITFHIILDPQMLVLLSENPGPTLLYGVSFLTIIPIAYVLAQRYRIKDAISKTLSNQIEVEESILANLDELVIVLDKKGRILSLNDAVEETLHKSRSELLRKALPTVLFLKDKSGNLLTKEQLSLRLASAEKTTGYSEELQLLTTDVKPLRKVVVKIKPITDVDGATNQFSVIIGSSNQQEIKVGEYMYLEEAQVKHEAMVEDLKRRLLEKNLVDLRDRLVIATRTEQDILSVRSIIDNEISERKTFVDVANLCRQTLKAEREFAQALRVSLDFALLHFGHEDIKPLLSGTYTLSPEQLTGPFFTVQTDVKLLNLLIQKLVDMGIMLASGEENNPLVLASVERSPAPYGAGRSKGNPIFVKITAPCRYLSDKEKNALFIQYYDTLDEKTNLRIGSGLEGYIAKTIAEILHIPLETSFLSNPSRIVFFLQVPKEQVQKSRI